MIIDTKARTVTIEEFTVLDVDDLKARVELLGNERFNLVAPQAPPTSWYEDNLRGTWYIESYTKWDVRYTVVRLTGNTWLCSCPDWMHRKSVTGEYCKHIRDTISLSV